ncbi:MAG TPA: DUF4245 domain-containing protein [Mycobacteriales bacterium]|nr:DUF4245 domain-containing protein [Mycobacteriales bacterium]
MASRTAGTIRDMVLSLGVLLAIVGVTLLFVPGLLHPSKSERFAAVSYSDDVEGFHVVTGQRAFVPAGLSTEWYANSAALEHRGDTAHLHIGFVTPNSKYLALEESNAAADAFILQTLGRRGLVADGTARIGEVSWQRHVSARGELSLSRTVGGVTVVITGSGSQAQLALLAGSLTESRA